ncbi:hypothetical protein CL655_00530 [bacterium]|nr:hypothetical protein [bacterium]|tara:strand:+ start:1222 stop:1638 length:417 start_codon:yes stop_codon:yes gene_type:complete
MIKKADILKMVKNVYRHSRGLPPRRLVYPAREWGIGVITCGVLAGVVLIASGQVYVRLNNIENTIAPAAVSTVRYQQNTVDRSLDLYIDRALQFERIGGNAPVPAATSTEEVSSEEEADSEAAVSAEQSGGEETLEQF